MHHAHVAHVHFRRTLGLQHNNVLTIVSLTRNALLSSGGIVVTTVTPAKCTSTGVTGIDYGGLRMFAIQHSYSTDNVTVHKVLPYALITYTLCMLYT